MKCRHVKDVRQEGKAQSAILSVSPPKILVVHLKCSPSEKQEQVEHLHRHTPERAEPGPATLTACPTVPTIATPYQTTVDPLYSGHYTAYAKHNQSGQWHSQ